VRIVRTPDGQMMMDATGRLAGRGAYLCDDPTCRRTALSKNILTRALGVPLPDELRAALEIDALSKAPERSSEPPGEGAAVARRTAHAITNERQRPTTPGGTIGQE
jgi:predicted RNA-binding protein YlxR (DUF448 family)